jgi:lysozyme
MPERSRAPIKSIAASAVLLVSLAGYEGYREIAYIPVEGDVPTLGFGTTDDVQLGDTIDPVTALQRVLVDVQKYEGAIQECVTAPLYQHEYDAFVSLSYNIGSSAFCKSTLVRKLNEFDYRGACDEILRWNKFRGKPLWGLTQRRQKEQRLCLGSP